MAKRNYQKKGIEQVEMKQGIPGTVKYILKRILQLRL